MQSFHKREHDMKNGYLEASDVRLCLKDRPKDCNKGDFGYIALMGGCTQYSGAIRLAAMANCAMRAGAGVVSIVVPEQLCSLIAENILECTLFPMPEKDGHISYSEQSLERLTARYRVIALGMGIGLSEDVKQTLEYLLKNYSGTMLIDADALSLLAQTDMSVIRNSKAKLVLTPHVGEAARLWHCDTDIVLAKPLECAKSLAAEYNAVVLLKGSTTIVSDGKSAIFSDTGCPGMATAGSGDVLSGILSALIACNKDDLLLATAAGAYINGLAGELAQKEHGAISMIASDTVSKVEEAIKTIIYQ